MFLEVARVHPMRRAADVERLEVPVEQLVERGAGARVALLVDLPQQPRPRALGGAPSLRARRNDLGEEVLTAGDRIKARVDLHAQGPARERLDLPPRSGRRRRHGGRCSAISAPRMAP